MIEDLQTKVFSVSRKQTSAPQMNKLQAITIVSSKRLHSLLYIIGDYARVISWLPGVDWAGVVEGLAGCGLSGMH